jgi:Asp-tRNA(Asn)/Glu-tRNA(Gln) amidotransferase A subunit family amidase
MTRSVEDCALVLGAIHRADPNDAASVDRPFRWPGTKPLRELRAGNFEGTLEAELKVVREFGVELVPVTLPYATSGAIVGVILDVEAAAAFDESLAPA